jgi:8-oxo-dGTP pyrophosphatase MutT (NUDIX family)
MNDNLKWKEESRSVVYTCPIFKVEERYCRSPDKDLKTFVCIDTSDWAIVIPQLETSDGTKFVMVRQWRHGAREMSVEFPGGVFEKGENPLEAAKRELLEETGYGARRIEKLGEYNPNPAIMSNRVHFYVAWELQPPIEQNLDDDEYVKVEVKPREEVLYGLGKAPYIHALMGTAMALYLKREIESGEWKVS